MATKLEQGKGVSGDCVPVLNGLNQNLKAKVAGPTGPLLLGASHWRPLQTRNRDLRFPVKDFSSRDAFFPACGKQHWTTIDSQAIVSCTDKETVEYCFSNTVFLVC